MPAVAPKPKPPPPPPKRVDAGDRQFTAPVAENDREGPISNSAAVSDIFTNLLPGLPFGYGSPYGVDQTGPLLQQPSPFLTQEEQKWGEVKQTTLATLQESNMIRKYGDDAVLVIASGPEDMKQLNHEDEAAQISTSRGESQETVVLWNPSPDAMTAMLKEGGFKDVVFSGHGDEGVVYMTGADGEAVAVEGAQLAGMMEDTSVQNIFLNVCHGLGGTNSVAESMTEIGVNAMGWMGSVADGTARQSAADWAARTRDGAGLDDMMATAMEFAGMGTKEGKPKESADQPGMDLFNWDSMGFWF